MLNKSKVIVIGSGPSGIAALLAKHLKVGDALICEVEPAKVIKINRGCIALPIKKLSINNGNYRQFEKRDKRKNFR
jgi:pyruvate/2-oxoglutarate dehydrogenase complex dihydrolipoamide dehydrogenase (E3) component